MTFGTGRPSIIVMRMFGRFQVSMHDTLLMGMLHRVTDGYKQFQHASLGVNLLISSRKIGEQADR